ncbi:MAG TPA: sensor histidine kinase [Puia sp.]|jgi:two-component system LytT family sensor kinase|nr:sensor histidine kinase [Puia sp.]
MKSRKIIFQVIIHIAVWACFLMLPFAFLPREREGSFIPAQSFSFYFVLINCFYIAFYYLNFYVIIPKLLTRKKVIPFVIVSVIFLLFFGLFPRLYHYFSDTLQWLPPIIRRSTRPRNLLPPLLSPGSIAIFSMVFAVSTGLRVVTQWFQTEQRNKEIENEKLNTELSFLKSQINPHFLFNTLNNIYSLAADNSKHTAEAVMKLSSIMRYVLTEAKNDCVPVEKEIVFIRHYIELQKLRLTDKSSVDFTVDGDPIGKKISPLLFLPFVENAFKYGISTREISPIIILLKIENNELFFSVKNNKHKSSLLKPAENTGIGINNSRRRLELLYRNRYSLNIDDTDSAYIVNLKINL